MSHRKRRRHKHFPSAGLKEERGAQKNKPGFRSVRGWFSQRKPVFFFLLIFGVLLGAFYISITFTPICKYGGLPAYHRFIAKASAGILSFSGESATAMGASISSPRFSVRIKSGCDAIEATMLFVCAILAFPADWLRKVTGIIVGTFVLAALNLVRIVSLFFIGVYFRHMVDFMHIEVWQGLFIIFAVMLWVVWLLWITRNSLRTETITSSGPGRS